MGGHMRPGLLDGWWNLNLKFQMKCPIYEKCHPFLFAWPLWFINIHNKTEQLRNPLFASFLRHVFPSWIHGCYDQRLSPPPPIITLPDPVTLRETRSSVRNQITSRGAGKKGEVSPLGVSLPATFLQIFPHTHHVSKSLRIALFSSKFQRSDTRNELGMALVDNRLLRGWLKE